MDESSAAQVNYTFVDNNTLVAIDLNADDHADIGTILAERIVLTTGDLVS